MNGWVILLIITALVAFLLSVWVRIRIVASPETRVFLRVCFFTLPIYPRKKKKVRPMKAWPKEKAKKEKKTKKSASDTEKTKEKRSLSSSLFPVKRVIAVVRVFFTKFPKHLHVDLRRLVVAVASPDAAKTAIEYGLVSQALAYLAELIDCHSHLHIRKKSEVSVCADFVSQKSRVEIDITLRIRVIHILALALHSALTFLKTKEAEPKTPNEATNKQAKTIGQTKKQRQNNENNKTTAKTAE